MCFGKSRYHVSGRITVVPDSCNFLYTKITKIINLKYLFFVISSNLLFETTGFPSSSAVKNLPPVQEPRETQVQSLSGEDPLKEGVATLSSILENPYG